MCLLGECGRLAVVGGARSCAVERLVSVYHLTVHWYVRHRDERALPEGSHLMMVYGYADALREEVLHHSGATRVGADSSSNGTTALTVLLWGSRALCARVAIDNTKVIPQLKELSVAVDAMTECERGKGAGRRVEASSPELWDSGPAGVQ